MDQLWPLAVYSGIVVVLAGGMILLSHLLGQRHMQRATAQPYECGIIPTGSARIRVTAKFYLLAMFFVIFDLEAVFIFAWATAVMELGWRGYLSIVVFIAVLMAALAYLWRLGALDWGTSRRQNNKRNDQERLGYARRN